MSVRFCENHDIEYCKDIWRQCFPDDADFADFYFERVHDNKRALVNEIDGRPVSYDLYIPFETNTSKSCCYIYAVSTLPAYRGRGIMDELFKKTLNVTQKYDIKVLIPSINGLYERYGFKPFTDEISIPVESCNGMAGECNDIVHLNYIYDIFCKKFDIALKRSNHWWNIIMDTMKFDNCKVIANEGAYAVLCGREIYELAYISEEYRDKLGFGKCNLVLPQSLALGNFVFGNNYLSLMLD